MFFIMTIRPNVVDSLLPKGPSTLKIRTPGSGHASVRQKDLWFESNTTLNGGEDQVLMAESYLKEGISTSELDRSLSRRGRGETTLIDCISDLPSCLLTLCIYCILLSIYRHCKTLISTKVTCYCIKILYVVSFQVLSHPDCPAALSGVPV